MTPENVKNMNRFQREIFNQHKTVYHGCEDELKQARDDYKFKIRANETFSKAFVSDEKVKS